MGHFENTMKAMGMEITRHDHSKSRTPRALRNCMPHGSLSRKALLIIALSLSTLVLTSEEASLLALEYNVNPIVGSTENLFDLTPQYVSPKFSRVFLRNSLSSI